MDTLNGRRGNDRLYGEGDNDTFVWNPADQNDLIEGGGGEDTLVFTGSVSGETISLTANGSRLLFFRNPAGVALDVDGVERVTVKTVGGTDSVVVNNLAGTAVTLVTVDFAAPGGGIGDLLADVATINGSDGADV